MARATGGRGLIRVHIDSTSPVARAGLEALLDSQSGIELTQRAAEAEVILRDGFAGPANSVSFTPVVLLGDEPLTARAVSHGVRAVVPHHAGPLQIVAALHAAAAGLVAVPLESVEALTAAEWDLETEPLTPRELEVLDMLAEGISNKLIAARLSISGHTAKFHVNSILGKLGAATRTEAVTKGIRAGILKL